MSGDKILHTKCQSSVAGVISKASEKLSKVFFPKKKIMVIDLRL